MRPIDIKTINYRGNKATKSRRPFPKKFLGWGAGALVIVAGIGYVLFFAPWLRVNAVEFQGVEVSHQDQIKPLIEQALDHKKLGLETGRDIFLVNTGALKAELAAQFSFLKDVQVYKKYFHTLEIVGTERQPAGVWCFDATDQSADPVCQFFDDSGVLWGQAIQSSGSLFVNVNDERVVSGSLPATVDSKFLAAIEEVHSSLTEQGIKFKNFLIPAGSYTEFDVIVSDGYPLKFSLDSDIAGQLKVYQIFRQQKLASGSFNPQYLDLRYDGRVYYK